MVPSEHLLIQQSESTLNNDVADINASDIDTEVNDKNTTPDNEATLAENTIDS
jgi:hypothetical protein